MAITADDRAIDAEMKKPATPARGAKLAEIMNHLEIQNDIARGAFTSARSDRTWRAVAERPYTPESLDA